MKQPRCIPGLTILARFRDTQPGSQNARDAWCDWKAHKAGCDICSGRELERETAVGNGRPIVGSMVEIE